MFMRPIPTAAVALLGVVVLTAPSWAGMHRDATPEIAAILRDFVHACTPAQCAELEAIASNPASTRDDRVLAKVALGIDHTPDPADAPRLEALADNPHASSSARVIAGILLRFVHEPTAEDRTELKRLTIGSMISEAVQASHWKEVGR